MFVLLPQVSLAAISFVGSCSANGGNGANATLTLPGGTAADDLVIVSYGNADADNADLNMVMVTSGYTEVADLFSNDTFDANMGVYWKVMGGTPDTEAVADNIGGADTDTPAVCMVFRGVDTTTPMDVAPATAQAQLNTFHPNPPSVNHNNPSGVWTVIAGSNAHNLGDLTFTFPTGYTIDAVQSSGNDTADGVVGMGYNSGPSDPEDPGVITSSGTDSTSFAWVATTLALRPVAATAPTVTNSTGDSNVTNTSATMNGDITATGGADVTARGFAWGTNATLSNRDTSTTTDTVGQPFSTGVFSQDVSNLRSNTTYYYRAYATNSVGTGYASSIESFITTEVSTTRRMVRLFEGFVFKLFEGSRFRLFQQ